jgi:hypothetical protein
MELVTVVPRVTGRSEPTPPHHHAHLVDGPAPGHAEGQGTGELDEANDLAHQCVLVTTQATPMILRLSVHPLIPIRRSVSQWRLPSRSSGGPLVRDHVAGVAETVAIFVRVDRGIEPHAIRLTRSGTRDCTVGRTQHRRSGIRHDRTGVESRHHLAAPNGFKSKRIRDTLCRHWGAPRFSEKWLLHRDFRVR